MQKILVLTLTFTLIASISFAGAFSPELLEISAPFNIDYAFDGSILDIPVTITGTPATVIFLVFTRNKAAEISDIQNGYLGWHYVNNIDTCIYVSQDWKFGTGVNIITWEGSDADGNPVPKDDKDGYTYYLFAFDHVTRKQKAAPIIIPWEDASMWRTHDSEGLPIPNPEFYSSVWQGADTLSLISRQKWIMGTDIMDTNAIETCQYLGYKEHSPYVPHPNDIHGFFSYSVDGGATGHVKKYSWTPYGVGVLDDSWGNAGEVVFSFQTTPTGEWVMYEGAIDIGNNLIIASATDISGVSTDSILKLIDVPGGYIIDSIDLTDWWIRVYDGEAGGQQSSGPNDLSFRDGFLFMGSHSTCMNQVIEPNVEDVTDELLWNRWVNQNGDYTGDRNFEDTAFNLWICHDHMVGPYKYNFAVSENLFSAFPVYDCGAVSYGLYAPDGTGLGYYACAGAYAGGKWMARFLANGSAYDGMYFDGMNVGDNTVHFVGQDTFRGTLGAPISVEEDVHAKFAVSQNNPNPFNPSTTINFETSEPGIVTINVFNVAGQKVDTIVNEYMDKGTHSSTWDSSGYSAGVYFYTVKSENLSKTKNMTLLK